jgi:hypothetical protein
MNFDSSCQRILKGSSGMILRTEVLTLRWFKIRMNMVSKNAFREARGDKKLPTLGNAFTTPTEAGTPLNTYMKPSLKSDNRATSIQA